MVHPLASASERGTSAERPLAGVGVLITRPVRQSAAFASKVAALGGQPIIFPAIVVLPPSDRDALERAHDALDTYQLAFFVSANAVEYGVPDARRWPSSLIAFAPGPGTAEALADAGIANVRTPEQSFDSEGLLALPELSDVAGKRAVIFRGYGGRELIADTLRDRGAHVDHVECYRRASPQSGVEGISQPFADQRIDAITITSSEGLDNLWRIVDSATRNAWRARPTFVPHPRIAEHANALGLHTIETAAGDAGLLRGLLEWFANHRPHSHHR